jgi:transcriptional regulator with XRE-family HTH domain
MTSKQRNGDLGDLSPSERLYLWRRRARLGQAEAARRLKCSLAFYSKMERGIYEGDARAAILAINAAVVLVPPTPREQVEIALRRHRGRKAHVAASLRVSRPTLDRLLASGDPRVRAYFEKRGFTFASR